MGNDPQINEQLPGLTERLIGTYRDIGSINQLGQHPLPSTEGVYEIARDLKEIVFPGYRQRQNLNHANIGGYVRGLIDNLQKQLTEQITRALRHQQGVRFAVECGSDREEVEFAVIARTKTIAFLESVAKIREVLATDVQAAYDGDPAAVSRDEVIFCYPGLEAITVHRLAHELYRLDVPLIPRMLSEWSHSGTGIDIHPGARIGPSFFIDHGTGVVIGETTEIAANVKIYQGVTLGALSFPKDAHGNVIRRTKRHPTIEEGVVVYAGATILGGDTVVGAGAVIGAGVSIYETVPPNTVVTLAKPDLRFRDARLKKSS